MSEPALLSDIETIWTDLRDLLAWQTGFGLYLVFAEDARRADVLLNSITDWCGEHGLPIQAVRPVESQVALTQVLDALPGNPAVPNMPLWLDLGAWSSNQAWLQVRREILTALNQRRSWLEQACQRPIFLHLPQSFAPEVVTWAPDLWSIKRYLALLPMANPLQATQAMLNAEVAAALAAEDEQVAQIQLDLVQVLAHYSLLVPPDGNLQALRDVALAIAQYGQNHSGQNQHAEALVAFQDSLALLRHLRKRTGDTPQAQADVANALLQLANAHMSLVDLEQARNSLHSALGLHQRLMAGNTLTGEVSEVLITVLHRLAELEMASGNHKLALAWLENTLPLQRKLAQAQEESSAALPDLLKTLHSLAKAQAGRGQIILADEHQQEACELEALLAAEREVHRAQVLVHDDWIAYGAELARCLSKWGNLLAKHGKRVWALKILAQEVIIREKLAEQNFVVYGPDLARNLNNWSIDLAAAGELAQAQSAIERAVTIYEDLAAQNFTVYGPDLAMSLNNWSLRLADTGQQVQALIAIKRAVRIDEDLAGQNFAAYGPDLAKSLNHWSLRIRDAGEQSQAVVTIQRAVQIYESLVQQNPSVYEPELAGSLAILADLVPAPQALPYLQRALQLITPYALPDSTYERQQQKIEYALQMCQSKINS